MSFDIYFIDRIVVRRSNKSKTQSINLFILILTSVNLNLMLLTLISVHSTQFKLFSSDDNNMVLIITINKMEHIRGKCNNDDANLLYFELIHQKSLYLNIKHII